MSLEGLSKVASIGSSVAGITRSVVPIITAGTGAAGNIIAARGTQQTADFNAKISELEADLTLQSAARSDLNAQIARNAAAIEAGRALQAGRKVQGTQAAVAAHAGVVVTEGSPLLAQLETLRRSDEDAVLARWKGDVTATGLEADAAQKRIQAQALKTRAQMLRVQGRRAILTGTLGALEAGVKGVTAYENLSALRTGIPVTNLRAGDYSGYGYD